MSQIIPYVCGELGGIQISCIIDGGEPWFKAFDVASALKYRNTNDAIKRHVADDDKREQGSFTFNPRETRGLKGNWKSAVYINDSGLYCLIFGSDLEEARIFKHWVTREVLPQIRKTGSYHSNYHYYRDGPMTWVQVNELAEGREDELHYKVVKHIRARYPDATLNAGLGEHLTTRHARMDSWSKGYSAGQPDITVIRGLPNGFQDALAIELKNPNGKGILSNEQVEYHKHMKDQCNMETIVGCDYDDLIIRIHDHYTRVFAKAQPPAIQDKQPTYNFATNSNPQYWCNKLVNKLALFKECKKRRIPKHEFYSKSNREIASILITFDKEQKSC
jgi:prophage antirepressor-like protein